MGKNILNQLSGLVRFVATVVVFWTVASGCGGGDSHPDRPHVSDGTRNSVEAETYAVTGSIVSVTPDRDFLMVRHDAIEGFMDAMTMPFAVRDTALVSGIAAGDSVSFVIEVARGEATITSIEKH